MTKQRIYLISIGVVAIVLVLVALLGYLVSERMGDSQPGSFVSEIIGDSPQTAGVDLTEVVLPSAPVVKQVADMEMAPLYVYLFTHTEDAFNHELYEERYLRTGALIEEVAQRYPSLGLTWIIEFMGADAEVIQQRNDQTGLADYLNVLKDRGLVEIGYHTFHDPTYNNRPQNALSDDPSYEDLYNALFTWVTCQKDRVNGGCTDARGGGLEQIAEVFGEVEIVTGLGYDSGFLVERSAGIQVLRSLLSDHMIGFGLPDHGSLIRDRDYIQNRDALMALLVPNNETTSGVFWMDGILRINDAATVEDVNLSPLIDGVRSIARDLSLIDRTKPLVVNAGIASKYLYTAEGTSPTIWAYTNPESPELPEKFLKSTQQRELGYAAQEDALEHLASYLAQDGVSRFVDSNDVVDLFTSDDYWQIDQDELTLAASWTVHEWDGAPPVWVYDGEDFYSLVDTFVALTEGLNGEFPTSGIVSQVYGPWSLPTQRTRSTQIALEDLVDWAKDVRFADNRVEETYEIGGTQYTATQLLYALSYAFLLTQQDRARLSTHIEKSWNCCI